ncbi:MAG: phytanoyl-CoA dioxygenase family protein [Acidimicrobiaceae bacterium]|nr:phytanoyl-CoA dioxygenase family protein [Acidimicrobiaceae bacterium]MYE08410.1 phytanoyl-CoA dioxygenase family protein [Acidimicrobiaceae bacterium]MYI35726.1 phytanoyl-CoA dioxygenase family protein [Acidimicrobiaceae bacterium]
MTNCPPDLFTDLDSVELPRLEPAAGPQDLVAALDYAGCAVVDSLASAGVVSAVLSQLEPHMEATATGQDDVSGHLTRRTGAVPARAPASWELLRHPLVLSVAEHYLAPPGQRFHICTAVTSELLPGQGAQPVHRDQWTYGYYPWPSGFEVELNVLWALCDFTEGNGGTRVAPGSHKWPDGLEFDQSQTVGVSCRAGSAVFVLGSCYHGAGANRSDRNRTALSVGYQRAWLRQGENQYLNCPPEVARELPEDIVRLLGYQRGSDALGYWRDGEDPMTAVYPDRTYHVGLGMGPEPQDDGRIDGQDASVGRGEDG